MFFNFVVVLSAFYVISSAEWKGKSYSGGNCGFVFDSHKDSIYPLDICITDYDADNNVHPYQSREYICTQSNGKENIEVYTYYTQNCTGSADEQRSALGSTNRVFSCGSNEATNVDDCFLEYRQYELAEATDAECTGWEQASYTTKYEIVGACVGGPNRENVYSRCDPADDTVIEYVKFNDETCCDLSYIYTGKDNAVWKSHGITTGCNDKTYIDPNSWSCNIPQGALDEDVFTDNTAPECTDCAIMLVWKGVVVMVVAAALAIN